MLCWDHRTQGQTVSPKLLEASTCIIHLKNGLNCTKSTKLVDRKIDRILAAMRFADHKVMAFRLIWKIFREMQICWTTVQIWALYLRWVWLIDPMKCRLGTRKSLKARLIWQKGAICLEDLCENLSRIDLVARWLRWQVLRQTQSIMLILKLEEANRLSIQVLLSKITHENTQFSNSSVLIQTKFYFIFTTLIF